LFSFLNFEKKGKIFGAMCAVTGVIIVAMPIGLLANNFQESYKFSHKKEVMLERYYERMDKIDPSKSLSKEQKFINKYKKMLQTWAGLDK
jgi:formate-dependent nitrite reductase cytochrome c552 subunit